MAFDLSLKKQLESMNTGDVTVTTLSRNGVYVAAKRAGWKVKTLEQADGKIRVTVLEKIATTPKPKISQFDGVLQIVRDWTRETRLKLFEEFELCCGMNRGSCICPDADPVIGMFGESVELPKRAPLSEMRFEKGYQETPMGQTLDFIAKAQAKKGITQEIEVEPEPERPSEWIDIGEKWNEITGEMVEMQRHFKNPNKFREKPKEEI